MPRAAPRPAPRAGFRDVLRIREFRTLLLADLGSLLGDQLAAVALGYLLFERTGSAFLAAAGYAITWLPALLGGPLLAAAADRLPPRAVLIGTDLGRAGLVALAALPGMPLPALAGLVLAAAMLAPAHEAARAGLLVVVLPQSRLDVGTALRNAVHQGSYLVGFGAGGAVVLLISAPGALLVDAGTFLVSALLLRLGLAPRPAAHPAARTSPPARTSGTSAGARSGAGAGRVGTAVKDLRDGVRMVAGDRALAWPLALGAVGAAASVVPEALAPAYAAGLTAAGQQVGQEVGQYGAGAAGVPLAGITLAGPVLVGLVLAATTSGNVLGGLLLTRFAPDGGRRLIWPLALAGMLPLIAVATGPGLWLSLLLFALTGAAGSFQVSAQVVFAAAAPATARARVFAVAMAVIAAAQAIAATAAGALAEHLAPAVVIAAAGAAGAAFLLCMRPLAPSALATAAVTPAGGAAHHVAPRPPTGRPIRHRPGRRLLQAARHRA